VRRPIDTPEPARVALRPMRPEDLDRVVEIERGGFRHPWSRDLLEREMGHAWSVILLACEPGPCGEECVLGYVVFWLVHDEVHVLNIATAVEARRRGIGRQLMDAAHAHGRKRGAALATLEVRRSNGPAIGLYASMGYRTVAVRPGYYQEENEDALVMILDLQTVAPGGRIG
jgi:ribosomal-protein-alanine N-acetyltransferase